jgi:hypothetical protein
LSTLRTVVVIVCLAWIGGCAHQSATPQADSAGDAALNNILRWEIETPATIAAGTMNDVRYTLTNVGAHPLDLCIQNDGVSTWISDGRSGTRWIAVLYGATSNDACHMPLHLEPGGGKTFAERAGVPSTSSPGPATLHGTVMVNWPEQDMRGVIRAERNLEITAR